MVQLMNASGEGQSQRAADNTLCRCRCKSQAQQQRQTVRRNTFTIQQCPHVQRAYALLALQQIRNCLQKQLCSIPGTMCDKRFHLTVCCCKTLAPVTPLAHLTPAAPLLTPPRVQLYPKGEAGYSLSTV